MKSIVRHVPVIVVLGCLSPNLWAIDTRSALRKSESPGALIVRIFDATNMVPVAGAPVIIVPPGIRTYTNTEGAVFFLNLAPDVYSLVVGPWIGQPSQPGADILVSPGETVEFYFTFATYDQEGDGIDLTDEFDRFGTDPARIDTDGDGLPDAYEVQYGFDPTQLGDDAGDPDDDGLSTLAEYVAGSNPRIKNKRRDGIPAGFGPGTCVVAVSDAYTTFPIAGATVTLYNGTVPLVSTEANGRGMAVFDSLPAGIYNYGVVAPGYIAVPAPGELPADLRPRFSFQLSDKPIAVSLVMPAEQLPLASDSDGDGLSDFDEVKLYGTNPFSPDTDDDGLPDDVEVALGADPLQSLALDVSRDGSLDAVDVQGVINIVLLNPGDTRGDVNGDGSAGAADVQLVINGVLGIVSN